MFDIYTHGRLFLRYTYAYVLEISRLIREHIFLLNVHILRSERVRLFVYLIALI